MMRTILGEEAFRKGSDLYFERHDGQAVTCEDFVKAMEDASGVDLGAVPPVVQPGRHARRSPPSSIMTRRRRRRRSHLTQSIPDTPGPAEQIADGVAAEDRADRAATAAHRLVDERLILLDEAEASHQLRRRRRAAAAVDQPRFLGARPARGRAAARASSSGWPKSIPIRSPATKRCQELMYRALIAGARGEAADPDAGHRRDARHAALQRARRGVQGRGAVPAVRRR